MDSIPNDLLLIILLQLQIIDYGRFAKICKRISKLANIHKFRMRLKHNILAVPHIPSNYLERIKLEEDIIYPFNYVEYVYWQSKIIGAIWRSRRSYWCGYVSLTNTKWDFFISLDYYTSMDKVSCFMVDWVSNNIKNCNQSTKYLLSHFCYFNSTIGDRFGLENTIGFDHSESDDYDNAEYTCREKVIFEVIVAYQCVLLMDPTNYIDNIK